MLQFNLKTLLGVVTLYSVTFAILAIWYRYDPQEVQIVVAVVVAFTMLLIPLLMLGIWFMDSKATFGELFGFFAMFFVLLTNLPAVVVIGTPVLVILCVKAVLTQNRFAHRYVDDYQI